MSRFFLFGYGYVAQAFAKTLNEASYTGTARNPTADDSYVVPFREGSPISRGTLHEYTHFLVSIPPIENGDLVLKQHRQDFLSHPNVQWIGYLSSTGVYGDKQGAWVDELSSCDPSDETTRRRYEAEQEWLKLYTDHGLPVHIFRLSGIYGPGRSMIDRVLEGSAQRIHKEGQYFSRIHVDDIVQVLRASIENPTPGEIFNLADDEPSGSDVVLEYACQLLGRPLPPVIPFDQANLSPMAKRFYHDNRRVSNHKLKTILGVQLKYPTFREGLQIDGRH